MRKRLAVLALAVCLGTTGLFAQSARPGHGAGRSPAGSEDEFFGSAEVEAKQGTAEKQNVADVRGEGARGPVRPAAGHEHLHGGPRVRPGQRKPRGQHPLQYRRRGFPGRHPAAEGVQGVSGSEPRVRAGRNAGAAHASRSSPTPARRPCSPRTWTPRSSSRKSSSTSTSPTPPTSVPGKQVLKWGTGYFWNPTDLINIEHRSFTNTNALLQGVFGLRSDVVFSPNWHLYTFLNLNGVQADATDAAFAARSEFLVGSTEFAVSSWLKWGKVPVFGADLSTPLVLEPEPDLRGELLLGGHPGQARSVSGPYQRARPAGGEGRRGAVPHLRRLDVQDRVTGERRVLL